MRCRLLMIAAAMLAFASVSNAEITTWNCTPDGDPVISLKSPTEWAELGAGEYALTMNMKQNVWDYGHMVGWFTTNQSGDPTITMTTSVDNDTGAEWTDYHVNLYMDSPFALVPGSASVISPSGWTSVITAVNTIPGTYLDAHSVAHAYKGSIDYYAGTPVTYDPDPNLTGSLTFKYKMSYDLSGTINFTQEMYPTPEPATLVLLVSGLFGLLVMRRRYS